MDRLPCRGYFEGHTGKIYAIAYDDEAESLVSSARDGTVISWDGVSGRAAGGFTLPGVYACSMSYAARSRSLYVCGVPRDAGTVQPTFLRYTRDSTSTSSSDDTSISSSSSSSSSGTGWRATGVLGPDESGLARVVSCVRTLGARGSGDMFATGESVVPDVGTVRVYDGAARALEEQRPVASYSEHRGFVTTLCANSACPDMLVSGSQDGTVRVWDTRQAASVLHVVAEQDPAARDRMVTGVDARADVLVTGLFSGAVHVWDLRRMAAPVHSATPDGTPVLKVALCPDAPPADPVVAVSTSNAAASLHLLAPLRPSSASAAVDAPPAPCCFCDLAWGHTASHGTPVLYAAGGVLGLYTPELASST